MKSIYNKYIFLFLAFFGGVQAYSQRGPGGVTDDTNDQRNCRLWLDAGDLTNLADGDPVYVWHDKSVSDVEDSAFYDTEDAALYFAPIFRDAPSASINGKPVVSFESGGMLSIGRWDGGNSIPPSADLNSNGSITTTYEQTMFFAFRTSNNVTDRQIIWEEGGSDRGIIIFLNQGNIYIGAYDDRVDSDPGNGNVPAFGFTYKQLPVQANTTYVLSYVYDVPTGAHDNVLITNSTNPAPTLYSGLNGTLNGVPFPPTMSTGCCTSGQGVGGIFTHPDPIGIGGLNRTSYDETGDIELNDNATGTRLFTGRLAEICYYAYAMNTAQRVIVENYLAAKYFANVIQNDKFQYEASFGDGLIGIGRETASPIAEHNTSQGDNIFEIEVNNMATAFNNPPQYLMVGHNNNPLTWTSQNVPDTSSIRRLRRIWRWDRSGAATSSNSVTITLYPQDIAKLPPLPAGYTKYGIVKVNDNSFLPNFETASTEVIELVNVGGNYTVSTPITKGTYFSIVAIKPSVRFRVANDFAIEGNGMISAPRVVWVDLNYKPSQAPNHSLTIDFVDGSATLGDDYTWNSVNNIITFNNLDKSRIIGFNIVGDDVEDSQPIEDFNIQLVSAGGGLTIGQPSTLNFRIFDNDPPPKVTFQNDTLLFNESAGQIKIPLEVVGPFLGTATATIELVPGGSASLVGDFSTAQTQILSFTPSARTDSFVVNINDDLIDEFTEYFNLTITATTVVGFDNTVTLSSAIGIVDNDPLPTVSFLSAASEGFETISDPRIYAQLNTPSAKEVFVPYMIVGGDAINDAIQSGGDYSANPNMDTLYFPPGSIEQYLFYNNSTDNTSLVIYGNDAPGEPDETIIFELDQNPINAVLGGFTTHTYTIKEYSEFEWLGVAGVGKFQDNTFWMVPDAASTGGGASSVPNLSPRPVQILQDGTNNRPTITTEAAGRNNRKLVDFNGTNHYLKVGGSGTLEGQFPLINTGGLYDRKSIFLMFIPDVVNSSTPQVLYEQGGGDRGISIYIHQDDVYFAAWNRQNDGPFSPWGLTNNGNNTSPVVSFVKSTTPLQAGQPYILSCHYLRNMGVALNDRTSLSGMHLFLNGELEGSYTGDVGRLYTHSGRAALGAGWHQFKTHLTGTGPANTDQHSNYFNGKMGEVLYFNEPNMNEARVRILHNYFSAKYNIPLGGGTQDFDLTFADATSSTNPEFNFEVAGLGREGTDIHGDSQGLSELRVRDPILDPGTAFLTWGSNGESLTNTWPYSNSALPNTIMERSGKIWRFSSLTGGVTNVDIAIRFASSSNAAAFTNDPSLLKLLIHSNTDPQDFSTATIRNVSAIASGHVALFNNVPVTDGMYITLANTSSVIPLPIELLDFTARLNAENIDITWSTASELNNDYFVIERAGENLDWKSIMTVDGAGNSNTTLTYQEVDRDPLQGLSYYRLRQVDFDGTSTLSDVVSVLNTSVNDGDFVFVYPNPSRTGSILVRIPHAWSGQPASISLYDLTGKVVLQENYNSDSDFTEINYGELPKGMYILSITSSLFKESKKIVIE